MKFNRHKLLVTSLITALVAGSVAPVHAAPPKKGKKAAPAKPTAAPSSAQSRARTVGELLAQADRENAKAKKDSTALPTANLGFAAQANQVNLSAVKPPRSSEIMQTRSKGDQKAQYEKILDQQIQELYKLTQRFKTSPNRGELWLRLAELYVEKASIVDSRKQDEYDAKLRAFQEKKTNRKPVLELAEARDYNRKAVQLYEWFQRDFPKDSKMPQALFFLGYNYFELGDVKKGAQYYEDLTKKYPKSAFVGEAHFALGEYYFENEKWSDAYREYTFLIKQKRHRLHTFAMYKGGWCLFRLGKVQQGLAYLEYIIKSSRQEEAEQVAGKAVNRTRLEGEAMRDLVVFYAEGGDPANAANYFDGLIGQGSDQYLERLAYQYQARGNKEASREIFKLLIARNPTSPKSFEFQYQIVQNFFYAKNTTRFKDELYGWVKDYGKGSDWFTANNKNKELMDSSYKLRETTLRNYILQQHQTAQNSRAQFSQTQANEGYKLYLSEFTDSPSIGDMHFYYGELLYDMQRYDEAYAQYQWVAEKAPTSKFYAKAAQNLILSVEKTIPTDAEMQKRVGNSLDPVPLDPKVERFIKAGSWYAAKFPQSEKTPEIKFRIGRLYYQSNHFDEAVKVFRDIVKNNPKSKYAEYSANLILDVYNLKKDYAGLEKVGAEMLAVPSIAASPVGKDIKGVMEKASFKKGQDLEGQKKFAESAQAYEAFSKSNPGSSLATTALYNAGINYERAGQNGMAIAAYRGILSSKDPEAEKLKPKVRRFLAKQYQDSAQFEEAAKLYKQLALEAPKDPLSPNMMFNAAVLYDALGRSDEAIRAYTEFTKMNKKRSENVEVLYSIATIHRKADQKGAAIRNYMEYVETGGRDQEKVVESAYWVYELSKEVGAITRSKEWAGKVVSIQRRFAPNKKGPGASYAAKLKFADAMTTFKEMRSINFPANPAKQKAAADRKIGLLTKLSGELVDVIKYDSAEEIISSLALLGDANTNMAQAITNAPLPGGLNPEETKQYKAGVEKFAEPFVGKAKDSYKACVDRAWELEAYNDAYRAALDYMSKVDPVNYYNGGEVGSELRLVNWMGQ
ncbi:tetratricopeptide repeat protein [Bdellovibrio sp. HCB288]|uniref:tetratricopeptide repeat protein n=1 Tax=Bdellovibrio sp. HCB288 TaxID=3394355 RepID=UPI0039B41D86